ncbi:MAG: NUDIX hydrolase, partial [Rhodospirillales bacterium]
RHPRIGVGAIVWKDDQVLLVRRAKEPGAGTWSLPGGSQEWGETLAETAIREVHEETGVTIRLLGLVDVADLILPGTDGGTIAHHYTLIDFAALWVAGDPKPGDDALEARWARPDAFDRLGLRTEARRIVEKSRRLLALAESL